MKLKAIPLPWDSAFFGLPTARLIKGDDGRSSLDHAVADARAAGLRLLYLDVPVEEGGLDSAARRFGGTSLDRRIELICRLPDRLEFNRPFDVITAPASAADEGRLISLAYQSGSLSRFRLDPAIPVERFHALYREWMCKSLAGELADVVIVRRSRGEVVGMVTLSKSGSQACIGLFAVDVSSRGQGIGSSLLQSSLTWAKAQGATTVKVATQGSNESALAAYRQANFRIVSEEAIYHFWI